MSEKFRKSDIIIYVCDNADEIKVLEDLCIEKIRIGKKRCHDDFYEIHLSENLKPKLLICTFNNILNEWKYNQNKFMLINLPRHNKKLIKNLIARSKLKHNYFYKFFENNFLIPKLLLKLKFFYSEHKSSFYP